jgi:hypothetical protein
VYPHWASCLPGMTCTGTQTGGRISDHYQAQMTPGSWWDDGTKVYLWTLDGSSPGSHTVEAVTGPSAMVNDNSSAGKHQYIMFSYLQLEYLNVNGFYASVNNTANTLPTWWDNNRIGGIGNGPVTNESGRFYSAGINAQVAGVGSPPTGALTATELEFTNNTINWCGGHNCLQSQGTTGPVTISGNVVGTNEHNGIDVKGPVGTTVSNNYIHDAYRGTIIGSDPTRGQSSTYTETYWNAALGGTITWQNNTIVGANNGIFCNSNVTATGTQTCHMYNNTVQLSSSVPLGNAAYLVRDNSSSGVTLAVDAENNIGWFPSNNGRGFFWYNTASGIDHPTEKYNMYFSQGGTTTTSWLGTTSSTLAAWQASCGGGGNCGTGDIWQTDPTFAPQMGAPTFELPLYSGSPAIGSGTNAVGTSTTMGATTTVVPARTPTPISTLNASPTAPPVPAYYIDDNPGGRLGNGCLNTNTGTDISHACTTLCKWPVSRSILVL